MNRNEPRTVVFALCGSFCTFEAVLPQVQALVQAGWKVLPVLSGEAAVLDTRFGTARHWKEQLEAITGQKPLTTLTQVEPLGPQRMARAMVVAPCTGTTLAKLDLGISDGPVTLGVKSMLRGAHPVLLAPSTNDGLGASAVHIGSLLNRKHIYFVPFGQDDPIHKPQSLKSDFSLIPDALESALRGRQMQPVLDL